MSDKVEEAVKAVIDGVIGGDAVAFARGLRKLSEASPSRFLEVGSKLLNPSRDEYVHFLGGRPLFAFDDTKVYGAVLTPSPHDSSSFFFSKKVHPSGTGLDLAVVQEMVRKERAELDARGAAVIESVKVAIDSTLEVLSGHSTADREAIAYARAELGRGIAMLRGAVAAK
ncbi:hypothetical protein [Pseudomonas aeruginosa]|uniref:hypothetical protein n=1 Tax=Pseudomonas aeruginosa TaxID=287 RepID=UPI00053E1945|nr:hypothetical protein [Pseudomonas aeruginosa]